MLNNKELKVCELETQTRISGDLDYMKDCYGSRSRIQKAE